MGCSVSGVGGALGACLDAASLGLGRPAVGVDDLDPVLVQVRVQLLDLLLGDLDLLEACRDLRERQKAPLLPFGDQRSQLFELRDRRLVAQQNDLVNAHSP